VRQLHVLGVSDDGDTLLLGTSAKGKVTHRLSLDNRLRQAVRGQLTAPGSDRAESVLSPKEIQARLRAGATPDEVAKVARVPVARVLPYFAPVEAERERIVEEARSAVLHRSRGPQPTQPLGGVVDARLREVAGLKDDSVAWTARRRADGSWVVRLTYTARGGQRRAEWLWRPAGREVTALDVSATRLAAEAAPAPKRKPVRRPAAKKAAAPARKATAKKATARKATSSTAKKAAPVTKKVARKAAPAARKAVPAKKVAPAKKAVPAARKPAAKKPPQRRTAAPAVTAPTPLPRRPAKAAARPRVLEVVPDPVPIVVPVEPAVVAVAASVEAKPARRAGARVPIPSWSDVLIGVTGRDPDPDPGDDATPRTSSGGRRRRT
jgi:hypothetical protein